MKKTNPDLVQDVENLLSESVLTEAMTKVTDRFEEAWKLMDPLSAELLDQFFNGTPVRELSEQRQLSVPEVETWLRSAKRELVQHLRSSFRARQ